jgi:hypothetical protein
MKRTVRWVGCTLLVVAMLVMGGCSKCDLKTEDLAGNWVYLIAWGTCTGGADCAGFPTGAAVFAGNVTVDTNGVVYFPNGDPAGLIMDADCSGDVTGTWPGAVYLQKIEGTGSDNRIDLTATYVNGAITWTAVLTMTR